jgi:prepilin-type N-terminal cleavage/methylation domain-containing protein
MRLGIPAKTHAFTLIEMMVAIAIASAILGVTLTSSIALQKSFNSTDNYLATHMQQIRIVDFLARDVRRGLSVISSVDQQTVVVQIPKYIIQAGDSDANALQEWKAAGKVWIKASNIGTPRSPTQAIVNRDYNINYVPPTGFPSGAMTSSVKYTVNGSSIERWEDFGTGILVKTTIASSTDNLIPLTLDTELANTEYTTTSITFKPISVADRSGTIVYSTAYLRNRRRPPP